MIKEFLNGSDDGRSCQRKHDRQEKSRQKNGKQVYVKTKKIEQNERRFSLRQPNGYDYISRSRHEREDECINNDNRIPQIDSDVGSQFENKLVTMQRCRFNLHDVLSKQA